MVGDCMLAREKTYTVHVGDVAIGGGAPVVVQSMTNTPTTDVEATLSQIARLRDAGCDVIRVAVPTRKAVAPFGEICAASPIPVIADVHFDHQIAIDAIRHGAAGARINPGNIGSLERVDRVAEAAGEAGVPIRIGVNAGSLDPEVASRADLDIPERLAASAVGFVAHLEGQGFSDVVVSAKAHDVPTTIKAYELLSREIPQVPLHLGVTEAGTMLQGTVKSAVGLGTLLSEGIGDTLRVSLTADPEQEVRVGWEIISSLGLRRRGPELVSCPTCGRTQVGLIPIAEEVGRALEGIDAPITVAVMGCVVNGPGEASGADIGVACGKGEGVIFRKGKVERTVPEDQIASALLEEIRAGL